jgi:hypothetical protein
MIRSLTVLCSMTLVCGLTVRAEESASEIDREAESIFRDMLDQRMQLHSGVCRINGEKFNSQQATVPEIKGNVRVLLAFDHNKRSLRFDSEHPMFVRTSSSLTPEKMSEGIESPRSKWIQTPDLIAEWSKTTKDNFQFVHLRKADSAFENMAALSPFDVREAGLVDYMAFRRNPGIERTIGNYLKLKPIEVRKIDDAKSWLVLKTDWGKYEILVDRKRGMTATELRFVEPKVTYPGRDTAAMVEWEERNGVWVPKKYRIEFQIGDEYRDHRYYDFALNWESVNQPIDDALFDYQKMEGIPDGTEIVDTRVDPQKVIGRYGPERKYEPLVKPRVNNTMRWLLLANVLLLLLVLCYYWLKRRRQADV